MKRNIELSAFVLFAMLIALPHLASSQEVKKKPLADQEQTARVTLDIEGVESPECVRAMTQTLGETELKPIGAIQSNSAGPTRIVAACPVECDLGAAAAKVNQAQTPHREKVPPAMTLVLFATLDNDSKPAALATCRKIEGVDGTACKADSKNGEIQLRFSGKKKVTLDQITSALKDAGIQVRTTAARTAAGSTSQR